MIVPASSLRLLVEGLATFGVSLDACAEQVGVPSGRLQGEADTSPAVALALIDFALEVGGPSFGLEAGFAIPPGRLGLVDHLCAAAPTVGAALEDLERYFALVATGVCPRWDGSRLSINLPPVELSHQRLFAEITFGLVDQRMTSRSAQPLGATITFPWPAPAYRDRIERRWPSVQFDAPGCVMSLPADRVGGALASADATLRDLLDGYAGRELALRRAAPTVSDRVRREIVAALPGRPSPAGEVARALGMSPRTLRRALSAEGTRFSDVRDAAMLGVAAGALADPARTVAEVGWLLGYSEPSAFHRAFRRWTNSTPEQFRQSGQIGR